MSLSSRLIVGVALLTVSSVLLVRPSSFAWAQEKTEKAVTPKPTEAQLQALLETADAARLQTKANSKERGEAAGKTAQIASDLGWVTFDAGRYQEAATWFERAATLKKEENAARRAYWENELATEVLKSEADMEQSFAKWNKVLATSKDPQQKKTLTMAMDMLRSNRLLMRYNTVSMLQTLARDGHDNTAWLKYSQEILRIRREELKDLTDMKAPTNEVNDQKARIAKALEGIAWAQMEMGRLPEAEKNNLEALKIRQALPANLPSRELDEALDSLGHMYLYGFGDLKKAAQYYEAALVELDKSAALRLKEWQADATYTPEVKARMSAKEKAEHEKQRGEMKTLLQVNVALTKARHLTNLSYVAKERGDLRSALDFANRSLKVADSLPPGQNMWFDWSRAVLRSRALGQLTNLHADSGDMEVALKELDESIQIKRELGDDNSTASSLQQAGRIMFAQDKFDAAKPYIEQARRIFASAQNLDGVVASTGTLAMLARDTGQLEEAQAKANEALALARQRNDAANTAWALRILAGVKVDQKSPAEAEALLKEVEVLDARTGSVLDRIATLSLQGQTLELQGQSEPALAKYREAITLLEGVRATADSESNFSNVKANYKIYERMVRLLIQMGRSEEAFETLGRAKSKQLQDSLSLTSVQSPNLAVRAKLDNATTLDARLRAIIAQLESELNKPKAQQSAEKIRNLQTVRAQTQGEFYAVLDDLKKTHPQFDIRVEPADVKAIQRRIPDDTLLIQYAPLDDKMFVFLFSRQSLKIVETGAPPTQIWDLIKKVRPQLARDGGGQRGVKLANRGTSAPQGEAPADLETNLTGLYEALIAPIEADIAEKKTLAFIPTQWLYYLPMQVLAKKQDGKLHYLIEDKNVVYLETTGQVTTAMLPRVAGDLGKGLVAFGDPTGAGLPEARAEVDTIGKVFPDSQVFSGAQVEKVAVMNEKNWDRRVLHFATHGVLNASDPKASYIQLAPGQKTGDDQLTVGEIQGLPLEKIDVVTLSACQTALGEREPGREVLSLAGAFERAGATSIVASLWSVADESTKDLMVEFYTQLAAGKTKAEALRAAQLKVRENPEHAHPYYWAPFVLMGNWR